MHCLNECVQFLLCNIANRFNLKFNNPSTFIYDVFLKFTYSVPPASDITNMTSGKWASLWRSYSYTFYVVCISHTLGQFHHRYVEIETVFFVVAVLK